LSYKQYFLASWLYLVEPIEKRFPVACGFSKIPEISHLSHTFSLGYFEKKRFMRKLVNLHVNFNTSFLSKSV